MPHHHPSSGAFLVATATWFVMMAAMMAPAVWPWVRSYSRFGGGSPVTFASGYLVAWLGYSIAAAAVQARIHTPASIAPLVLVLAGAYQLAPWKRACLTHCRNPLSYFLARWRSGAAGAFRMGAEHGLVCVGCCWALMATMLAVGVTNAWWMIALGAVACVEQVAPGGHRLRAPAGIALILIASRV